jgi:hypothetical protein
LFYQRKERKSHLLETEFNTRRTHNAGQQEPTTKLERKRYWLQAATSGRRSRRGGGCLVEDIAVSRPLHLVGCLIVKLHAQKEVPTHLAFDPPRPVALASRNFALDPQNLLVGHHRIAWGDHLEEERSVGV